MKVNERTFLGWVLDYNLAVNTCLWWASSVGMVVSFGSDQANKAPKHAIVTFWVLWYHSDVHETCLYWLSNRPNKVVWLGFISMVCNGQRFSHHNSNSTEISTTPLTLILIQWSRQNFVHGMTAVLSWHVQIFVVIWWPDTELQQSKIPIEFELGVQNRVAYGETLYRCNASHNRKS